jgi:hypothetical protein
MLVANAVFPILKWGAPFNDRQCSAQVGPFPVKSAALLQNVMVAMQISTKADAVIGPRVYRDNWSAG